MTSWFWVRDGDGAGSEVGARGVGNLLFGSLPGVRRGCGCRSEESRGHTGLVLRWLKLGRLGLDLEMRPRGTTGVSFKGFIV